jgi:arabinofuranosyltransferase
MDSVTAKVAAQPRARSTLWLGALLICVLFGYIYLATAWLGDDAFISMKQVWNAVHGFGFTLETGSRVQAFTHPLWVLIESGLVFITRELFLTNLILSAVCAIGALALAVVIAWRSAPTRELFCFALVPLLFLSFSQAFTDYMSSGLENPLSYLIVGLIVAGGLDRLAGEQGPVGRPYVVALLCSLLALTRLDLALLVAPLGLVIMLQGRQLSRAVLVVLIAALPLIAWHGFALWYFGAPLPNTFHAKLGTGIPLADYINRGQTYLLHTIRRDNITFTLMALAVIVGWWTYSWLLRSLMLGVILYVGYALLAGGDFMLGRSFSVPVFVSALTLVVFFAQRLTLGRVAMLLPISVAASAGFIPILSGPTYGPTDDFSGTTDERGAYYQLYGLLSPVRDWPVPAIPTSAPPTEIVADCGWYGRYVLSVPERLIIDDCALGDALLARLPAITNPNWKVGHLRRRVPEGYLDYRMGKREAVADPALQPLVDDVALATRGDLFDPARWGAIWRLNVTRPYSYDRAYFVAPKPSP